MGKALEEINAAMLRCADRLEEQARLLEIYDGEHLKSYIERLREFAKQIREGLENEK